MMMQQLKPQTNKIKGDYFWDVTIRHPSKESRPEIPKRKEEGRDSRIEDNLRVQIMRIFGGRRCAWFKVFEKVQQLC